MELGIIDFIESGKAEANVRLLWVAVVISPQVTTCGYAGHMLFLQHRFHGYSESGKFKNYIQKLKDNPENSPEDIKHTENMYQEILFFRKMKGKSKDQIVHLKKSENFLKELMNDFKNYFRNRCDDFKITELLELSHTNTETKDKPILAYYFPEKDTEESTNDLIRLMESSITSSYGDFSFFDGEIKKYNTAADMAMPADFSPDTVFLYDYLFSIPAPEKLNSQQLMVIRSELSNSFYPMLKNFISMHEALKALHFVQDNFNKLIAEYNNTIKELKPKFQQTLDSIELLNQLKTPEVNSSTVTYYKIYAGISSFEKILNFYHQQNIINELKMAYIKEEISLTESPKSSRLFFYLEKEERHNRENS